MKLYLVGSSIKGKKNPHDADIVGVMSANDFHLVFGYTHMELQKDLKGEPNAKTNRWKMYCRGAELALSNLFDRRVDFKFIPESMLYEPYMEIELSHGEKKI